MELATGRNCCHILIAEKSPPGLYRPLSRLAGNVTGQYDTETLRAENDTSPLFPSNDLPDVTLLCSRSHYSSVIDQNDGTQWLHKTSGAQEGEEEEGGSRSTRLRFWNHPHFSQQGRVEAILYFFQGATSLFPSIKTAKESRKIFVPNGRMYFFDLLVNTCLQKRHKNTHCATVYLHVCASVSARLCIPAVLFSTKLFFSASKPKGTMRGRS